MEIEDEVMQLNVAYGISIDHLRKDNVCDNPQILDQQWNELKDDRKITQKQRVSQLLLDVLLVCLFWPCLYSCHSCCSHIPWYKWNTGRQFLKSGLPSEHFNSQRESSDSSN